MTTNYPPEIDDDGTLPNDRLNATPQATNHPTDHNNLADAIIALETKVGVTGSTVPGTLDAVAAAVNGLVTGAPGALDTLNELAAALGDDANFASTIVNLINAHTADASDAHDASAISVASFPGVSAPTVQLALEQIYEEAVVAAHPGLAAHDTLGLATQTELTAHAATPHGEGAAGPWFDVTDAVFAGGADPTGAGNAAPAFQAAHDAATVIGGMVLIPQGTFTFADGEGITAVPGIRWWSPGRPTISVKNAYAFTIATGDPNKTSIENLKVVNRSGATTGGAVRTDGGAIYLSNVYLDNVDTCTTPGFWLRGWINGTVKGCQCSQGQVGYFLEPGTIGNAFSNANTMERCRANSQTIAGFKFQDSHGWQTRDCISESNEGVGVWLAEGTSDTLLDGWWFEDNADHNILIEDAVRFGVVNCRFQSNAGNIATARHIKVTTTNVNLRALGRIVGNDFTDTSTSGVGIDIGADVYGTRIRDNRIHSFATSAFFADAGTKTDYQGNDDAYTALGDRPSSNRVIPKSPTAMYVRGATEPLTGENSGPDTGIFTVSDSAQEDYIRVKGSGHLEVRTLNAPSSAGSAVQQTRSFIPYWDETAVQIKALARRAGGGYVTLRMSDSPSSLIIYNVKEYGLIGDGVADDTGWLQTLVHTQQTTGGIIYFPPGTYLVSNILYPATSTSGTVAKTCIVRGAGMFDTIIKRSSASTVGTILGIGRSGQNPVCGQWDVADLTIDGNFSGVDGGDHPAAAGHQLVATNVPFTDADVASTTPPTGVHHYFRRVRFYRPTGYTFQPARSCDIRACLFDGAGQPSLPSGSTHYDILGSGIYTDSIVDGNVFKDGSGNFVAFAAPTASKPSRVTFTNNVSVGHQIGGVLAAGLGSIIMGNKLGNEAAYSAGVGYDASTHATNRADNIVVGNTFTNMLVRASGLSQATYGDVERLNIAADSSGVGIDNAVAAAALGNVVSKYEVFDEAGASLGFIPIFDVIT